MNIEPVGQFNIDSTMAKLAFEIRKSLGSAREAGQYDASTAAPEPDWVAELCAWRDGGGAPAQIRMEQSTDGSRTGIHVHIRCRNTQIYKEGPTPNLAAKACVEKLKAGGAM